MKNRNLIIVVNFNQKLEIENYLTELGKHFPKENVVIVDDGSTDGSEEMAKRFGSPVIKHGRNRGIGAAIRTGLKFAMDNNFDGVLISSSNGKMLPAEFKILLDILDAGEYPYVQGSRFMSGGKFEKLPLFRRIMIPILSVVWSMIFGQKMSDITCGLRAYKVSLLRDPRIQLDQDWLERYELEYYLHIKFLRELKAKMIEVPITIKYGHLQKTRLSKIKPFSGWWSMARPFVFLFLKLKD